MTHDNRHIVEDAQTLTDALEEIVARGNHTDEAVARDAAEVVQAFVDTADEVELPEGSGPSIERLAQTRYALEAIARGDATGMEIELATKTLKTILQEMIAAMLGEAL